MSRIIAIVVAIAAVVLVAAALLAPFIIGFRVQDTFRSEVARISQKLEQSDATSAHVKLLSYDRGWFSSTAITRISNDGGVVDIKHDIIHGPYAVFGWAHIHSTPKVDAKLTKRLERLFNGPVFVVDSVIDFDGGVDVDATSSALTQPMKLPHGQTISWQGVTAHYDTRDGRGKLRVHAPGLTGRGPKFDYGFKNARLKAGGEALSKALAHPHRAGVWRSNLSFALAHFNLDDRRKPDRPVRASGRLVFKSRSDMDQSHHVFFVNNLTLDNVDLAVPNAGQSSYHVKKSKIRFSISGLKAKPLANMIKTIRDQYRQVSDHPAAEKQMRRQMAVKLLTYLPRVVSSDTAIRLGVPGLAMPAGKANAKINVQLAKSSQDTGRGGVIGLLRRLAVDVNAAADDKLVRAWMAPYYDKLMVRQRLAILTARGILRKDDNRYRFSLSYNNGTTRLNGKPANGLGKALLKKMF